VNFFPRFSSLRKENLSKTYGFWLALSVRSKSQTRNCVFWTETRPRAIKKRRLASAVFALAALAACGPNETDIANAGLSQLGDWFQIAASGQRGDEHCHAFGLLKHAEATCADMLEHASRIDANERIVTSTRFIECLETVCGEFLEVELEGIDSTGRNVSEIAVLKRDNESFRLYWYRTDSLISALQPGEHNDTPEDDDRRAYTQLTNEHPSLYQFPQCLDVRVSSSNMVGALVRPSDIDTADFEIRTANCPDAFCIAFVGRKVAGVCP